MSKLYKSKNLCFEDYLCKIIHRNLITFYGERDIKIHINQKDYYLEVYVNQSKFIVYFVDCVYHQNDEDRKGEFEYYAGTKVHATTQNMEWEYQPNNNNVPWNLIRRIEGILKSSYIEAATATLYSGMDRVGLPCDAKGYLYPSKRMLGIVQRVMETQLCKIFQVVNEEDESQEYDIHVYPDYSDDSGHRIIAYIQIGYPQRKMANGYSLSCDDISFFLTLNLLGDNTCGVSCDFPWIEQPKNLFDQKPGTICSIPFDLDTLSAIKIMAYNTICTITSNYCDTPEDGLFVSNINEIGLETDPKKADAFAQKILQKLIVEFPLSKKSGNKEQRVRLIPYPNGITRLFVGIFVIDVAIDTCGLVDIGLTYNLKPKDTWDCIWNTGYGYPMRETDCQFATLQRKANVICYEDMSSSSRILVEEASKMVQETMYRIDEIVDAYTSNPQYRLKEDFIYTPPNTTTKKKYATVHPDNNA